jgi:hypothetical protein
MYFVLPESGLQKNFFRFFATLVVSLFLFSCEYEPRDVYMRTVNKNVSPPVIQMVELNLREDTIFLFDNQLVKFKFASDGQEIQYITCAIDSELIFQGTSQSGNFFLEYGILSAGVHDLSISVYTHTGTNSIADLVDAESFVSSKSWKLIVSRGDYSVIRHQVVNGMLQLSWPEYGMPDFDKFLIFRVPGTYPYSIDKPIYIGSATSNSYIDPIYVGQPINYKIVVRTRDGLTVPWGTLILPIDYPALRYRMNEYGHRIMSWDPCKYYNAVDSIIITDNSGKNWYAGNSLDTTVNLGLGTFLKDYLFMMSFYPHRVDSLKEYQDHIRHNYYASLHAIYGKKFTASEKMVSYFIPFGKNKFLYKIEDLGLREYNVKQEMEIHEFLPDQTICSDFSFINPKSSQSGNYLLFGAGCNRLVLNAGDYSSKIIPLPPTFIGYTDYAISDSGIAVLGEYNNSDVYLYDLKKQLYVDTLPCAPNAQRIDFKISSGSEYFTFKDDRFRIMRNENHTFTQTWSTGNPSIVTFFRFNPGISDQALIGMGDYACSIVNCNNGSYLKQYSVNKGTTLLDVDFAGNRFLSIYNYQLQVRSLTDGSVLWSVYLESSQIYSRFILFENAIVSSAGFFINFKL